MSYTDFCVRQNGSNLNSGTRTGNTTIPGTAADLTYASGTLVQSTGVFTVASGNPQADGVAVGDWASVYPDGSTVGVCIGRVTARNTTTITISTTILMGAMPTDGTGNRTVKIGGAWEGPSGTTQFPFNLAGIGNAVAATNDVPCINIKSDVTATMTAAITCSAAGPFQISGFASAYRDEAGKWTLQGATTGASYIALTISGARVHLTDGILINNGASGSQTGMVLSGGRHLTERMVVSLMRGHGCSASVTAQFIECEFSGNNTSSTTDLAGCAVSNNASFANCNFHDNTGANSHGLVCSGANVIVAIADCVFDSNGKGGVMSSSAASITIESCDFYGNVSGLLMEAASGLVEVSNSNFVANTTYGVRLAAQGVVMLHNCGFPAAGTTANGTDISSTAGVITNSSPITITANTTPWNAPSTGDFRITATSNKGTGRGVFTQLNNSKTGLVAYPDVGAGQTAAGGGSGNIMTPSGFTGGFNVL